MIRKRNSSTTFPSLLITFILLVSFTSYAREVSAVQDQDSTQVQNLLLLDTLSLQISGPSSDVSFYMNGVVFLSNTKYHQKMIPDHISFGVVKAYFVPLDYLSLESSRPLFPNDDFPYDPAGMSFSRDYKTVYFTKPVELAGRRIVEKIFEMSVNEGKATIHQQLPFTTEPSRYLHPAISQDDSILVFSSDRTPNSGGLDLFVSRKTASGWSAPVNLGRGINTSGHEWYPFLDHSNNLYFSSSGHMGFGGYDIYVCRWDGSGWGPPQNLTSFINTPGDELAFSIHPNNKISVFNRIMGTHNKGDVLLVSLNSKAFPAADAVDPRSRDICLLIQDMAGSGYTSGQFLASGNQASSQAFNLEAMPLLTLQEAEAEKKLDRMTLTSGSGTPDTAARRRLDQSGSSSSAQSSEQPPVLAPEEENPASSEPEVVSTPDPNRLNFRVQILSSTKPNTRPEVTVDGKKYATFEYFHQGAYRITVGDFPTVNEANAFRAKCKSSGFNQSFVAAFRGEVRETDPSVFRQQ